MVRRRELIFCIMFSLKNFACASFFIIYITEDARRGAKDPLALKRGGREGGGISGTQQGT